MRHLVRLNLIIYAAAFIASVGSLLYVEIPLRHSIAVGTAAAGFLHVLTLAIIYVGWKWIPGFSFLVFPNLSGSWAGSIDYIREGQTAELAASLDIEQNINSISLVLQTEDAESETIVVYPRRLTNRRLELLYVYETRRREGKPPPFYRYRGTAVMRLESDPRRLVGTYYTEQGGAGTVVFTRTREELRGLRPARASSS